MCCLFGLIDTQRRYNGAEKARMLHALAAAAEVRGTDATGYAYLGSGGLVVRKAPVPGHKLRFTASDDTAVQAKAYAQQFMEIVSASDMVPELDEAS